MQWVESAAPRRAEEELPLADLAVARARRRRPSLAVGAPPSAASQTTSVAALRKETGGSLATLPPAAGVLHPRRAVPDDLCDTQGLRLPVKGLDRQPGRPFYLQSSSPSPIRLWESFPFGKVFLLGKSLSAAG